MKNCPGAQFQNFEPSGSRIFAQIKKLFKTILKLCPRQKFTLIFFEFLPGQDVIQKNYEMLLYLQFCTHAGTLGFAPKANGGAPCGGAPNLQTCRNSKSRAEGQLKSPLAEEPL